MRFGAELTAQFLTEARAGWRSGAHNQLFVSRCARTAALSTRGRAPRAGRCDSRPEDAAPAPGTRGLLALHAARVAFTYGECNTRAEHGSGSPATPWLQTRHPAPRPLVLTKTTSSNSTAMKLKRDGY